MLHGKSSPTARAAQDGEDLHVSATRLLHMEEAAGAVRQVVQERVTRRSRLVLSPGMCNIS